VVFTLFLRRTAVIFALGETTEIERSGVKKKWIATASDRVSEATSLTLCGRFALAFLGVWSGDWAIARIPRVGRRNLAKLQI
jgi:hypothetical protein